MPGKPIETVIFVLFFPSLYSWKAHTRLPRPVGLADSTSAFSRAIKRKGERRKRVAYWQDCLELEGFSKLSKCQQLFL